MGGPKDRFYANSIPVPRTVSVNNGSRGTVANNRWLALPFHRGWAQQIRAAISEFSEDQSFNSLHCMAYESNNPPNLQVSWSNARLHHFRQIYTINKTLAANFRILHADGVEQVSIPANIPTVEIDDTESSYECERYTGDLRLTRIRVWPPATEGDA